MERGIWTRITMYVKIENKTQIRLNSSGEDVTESMVYISLYIIIQKIC